MKRLLITIFILAVLISVPIYGALTYSVDVDSSQVTSYWWTGTPGTKDRAWLWSKEVEDILEGTTAIGNLYFNPTDTTPTASEGRIYYNDTGNIFKYYNGSDWINISTATGNSLDTAYDLGNGITVDGTAVTLTVADGDNNSALAIVSAAATNDNDAVTITTTTAGYVGDSLYINGITGSTDIRGDSWNVSQAGLFTIAGGITINTGGELLVSARDVLFDDTYDVAWDTNRDQLIFQDNAVLGIGGAHDAAADVTIKWDASNMLIESAAEDTGEIQYGSTNAIDVAHYANTNTNIAKFNANTATLEFNGYDVQLQDDDILAFGDSDDFTVYYEETTTDNLIFKTAAANDAVQIGDGTTNTDLLVWGDTASTYMRFDASADELFFDLADLKISQGSQIEFIDVSDGLTDWTIDNATDETLLIYPTEITDDQSVNLGNATNTTDLRLFGATASTVVYDASADVVLFDAYNIALGDGDSLLFGDTLGTGDFSITDTSDKWVFDVVSAGVGEIEIGNDADDVPMKWFGETTGAFFYFVGDALQVDKADIAFSESDGLLFGDTLGTGDIRIDSTSAVLTIGQVAAGTGSVKFGVDDAGLDITIYGDTTGKYAMWDTSADALIVNGQYDIGTLATFTDSDGTPDVHGHQYWNTNTTTYTITDFDGTGIADGQIIYVVSKGAITFDMDGGLLEGGSTDIVTASGDLTVWLYDGTDWILISFTDQSDNLS